ncbi:MAG: response regulator transcription factor [Pedobacter sp.]|nr:MAG: response regulator transcription factor [Pedobacter sp.]
MVNKCILIDDEQYAIDALTNYIEAMPNLEIEATYTDPLLALSELNKQAQKDFIFLDIEMPGISGIELAKELREKCKFLIFTTGHPSYAVEAFDIKADHYLLKPVTLSKFALTINKLLNQEDPKVKIAPEKRKLQFVKGDQKHSYHFIDEGNITAIIADRNNVYVHTLQDGMHEVRLSLSQVESALGEENFIRINKSTIIAKAQIRKTEGDNIMLKDGKTYVLGSTFKKAFLYFMQANLLR